MNGKKSVAADRRRRKLRTLGWSLALLIVVIVLIAFEKTAILYILATVGISVLLLIVAFKDLDHAEGKVAHGPSGNRDTSGVVSQRQ